MLILALLAVACLVSYWEDGPFYRILIGVAVVYGVVFALHTLWRLT